MTINYRHCERSEARLKAHRVKSATQSERSNPLLIKLNFKIEFYFNWITSDFVLAMTDAKRIVIANEVKQSNQNSLTFLITMGFPTGTPLANPLCAVA